MSLNKKGQLKWALFCLEETMISRLQESLRLLQEQNEEYQTIIEQFSIGVRPEMAELLSKNES